MSCYYLALPFAVSRPLLRLGAGQRAKVEVLYQGQGLPTDPSLLQQ